MLRVQLNQRCAHGGRNEQTADTCRVMVPIRLITNSCALRRLSVERMDEDKNKEAPIRAKVC